MTLPAGAFAERLLAWFDEHGRHDLPWQQDPTPYRVWVSEIMLQQTRVDTVISYYQRFMRRFADVEALARADIDEVLHLWTGLGYYARARNLHSTAVILCRDHAGRFPDSLEALTALPGIGRSTAGAILALGFNRRQPILDGNVKRVLTRVFAIDGWPGRTQVVNQLWSLADELTPDNRVADYTQAIMDLGATLCTRGNPACERCPLSGQCLARARGETARYPAPKPAKAKPVRQITFLLLENADGELLLQRRPPSGIWGGLWGFPECADESGIAERLGALGLRLQQQRRLAPLRHTFSHFHLHINPVHCAVTERSDTVADEDTLCWYSGGQRLGLAAPVKKLIDTTELMNVTNSAMRKAG